MNKTKYSEQDIYKLIYLQKFLRKQLNIKNKLQDEIDYLLSFLYDESDASEMN